MINSIIIFEILIGFNDIFIGNPLLNIQEWLLCRVNEDKAKEYLGLILFNNKDSEIYKLGVNLSISYLIIISGLHINLLNKFFTSILSFVVDYKFGSIISLFILFIYVSIIGFPVSSMKSFLILVIGIFGKRLNKFDKFFITMIIVFLISPSSMFTFSYIYSFLLTFAIMCIGDYLPKNKLLSTLCICCVSFLITIPINIKISNRINLFSIIYSFMFTYPFLLVVVLSFLVLMFPFLSSIYIYVTELLIELMRICDRYSLYIHSFNFVIVDYVLYFLLLALFIILINKRSKLKLKVLFPICMLLISIVSINGSSNLYEVIFVNVYQGDCTIFKSKYGREIYMVDTGGSRSVSITDKVLKPMLEFMNVDCIRGLVITHSDYDHCGALSELVKIVEIKEIYYSLDCISIFGYEFRNINDLEYGNENDNSIVLYGEFYNMKLLLMGDVSSIVEKDIVSNYPSLEVDIIKVAHHGSKYSTSDILLDEYKPRIAILSYGYNHYGHPSSEVVDRLVKRGILIYSTFKDGTLFFYNYKKEIYLRRLK